MRVFSIEYFSDFLLFVCTQMAETISPYGPVFETWGGLRIANYLVWQVKPRTHSPVIALLMTLFVILANIAEKGTNLLEN